ncbi:MAG: AAA family ATPase [Acidimicrobiia bacterium]|nr:AAA family ATPase [Acidimicrobiia bacterium]
MEQIDVVLLTRKKETVTAVRDALKDSSVGRLVKVCKDLTEFRAQLSKVIGAADSGVAIVDIDGVSEHFLHELSKLTSAYVTIRFLAVATQFSEKLVLEAMQAGARHFLRESSIASELDTVLKTLFAYELETPVWPGKVVLVLSCSGGCGATTVAVNLANELQLLTAKQVLIIDLDSHYGSVGPYLGLQGDYGIAHVLCRDGVIDRHLIETSVVSYADGLDILLSPAVAAADKLDELKYENLGRAVAVCRESHDYVVIDAPRPPKRTLADLASVSQVALVVFQLTIKDVDFARSTISFLTDHGISRDRIIPVANRVWKRGPLLKLRDSQRAIGADSIYSIRNNLRKAVKSINRGRPLASVAKWTKLRHDFCKLATIVHRLASNE